VLPVIYLLVAYGRSYIFSGCLWRMASHIFVSGVWPVIYLLVIVTSVWPVIYLLVIVSGVWPVMYWLLAYGLSYIVRGVIPVIYMLVAFGQGYKC